MIPILEAQSFECFLFSLFAFLSLSCGAVLSCIPPSSIRPHSMSWLEQIMEFLPVREAFGCAKVCQFWLETQRSLDAKAFLHQLRMVCAGDINDLPLQRSNCRQLLRDWHECLKNSSLQVAYVTYDQHLIYVEPNTRLAKPPQGSDPFPVDTDAPNYHCLIKAFTMDAVTHQVEGQIWQMIL